MEKIARPSSNHAWCWRHGTSPLDLSLEDVALPELQPDEALICNHFAGLNPVDWKALNGRVAPWSPGQIPGVDGAGIVVAIGSALNAALLGQRVAYHQSLTRPGSFAKFTPVRQRALVHVPDALSLEVAAGMPCPALTAWQALSKIPVRPQAKLLIAGAGGGVGNYLVQFALKKGFSVTAMCNPRHWTRLNSFGVEECLEGAAASRPEDILKIKDRFLAVVDCVGPDHAARLAPAVKANGHIVCIQSRLKEWPDPAFTRTISMHEVALGALHVYGDNDDWQVLTATAERMMGKVVSGDLKPEAPVVRDFDALPTFLDELEHRRFSGKAILRIV